MRFFIVGITDIFGSGAAEALGLETAQAEYNARAEQAFNELDLDGGGSLDISEIRQALQQRGIATYDAERLLRQLDADGDGEVTRAEFAKHFDAWEFVVKRRRVDTMRAGSQQRHDERNAPQGVHEGASSYLPDVGGWLGNMVGLGGPTGNGLTVEEEEEAGQAFDQIDLDQGGTLDLDELKQALANRNVPPEDADRLLRQLDENGDGQITKKEFKQHYKAWKFVERRGRVQ